jgi:ferredoxin-NADP reductase
VARAAVLGRLSPPAAPLTWRVAEVTDVFHETLRARTIVLDVDGWQGHRAGQHVDIRLTAEDGYQAERSYSIASGPGDGRLELTVERIEEGEVSPYLVDELRPGDVFEVRGPIGGYFVWEPADGGPLLLVGGGSGIVPLRSMLRARTAGVDARLLYSSRTLDDVIYREELEALGDDVVLTLTRERREGVRQGRVTADLLRETAFAPAEEPRVYVCGPTSFVEAVASTLVEQGHAPGRIRTERFGPTGR